MKLASIILATALAPLAHAAELLNVSYDPTHEFYAEFNTLFAANWKAKTGETLKVKQSHGGSGKQARLFSAHRVRMIELPPPVAGDAK